LLAAITGTAEKPRLKNYTFFISGERLILSGRAALIFAGIHFKYISTGAEHRNICRNAIEIYNYRCRAPLIFVGCNHVESWF
jgi:hypothetical protein